MLSCRSSNNSEFTKYFVVYPYHFSRTVILVYIIIMAVYGLLSNHIIDNVIYSLIDDLHLMYFIV